jgi:hypothetical protein
MASLDSIDRDRLMRLYAPRLAQLAELIGAKAPACTVQQKPDTLDGVLDIQVIGDVKQDEDLAGNLDETQEEDPAREEDTRVPLGEDVPAEDDPDGDGADSEGETDNDSKVVDDKSPRPQFIALQTSERQQSLTNSSTPSTSNTISWKPIVTTSGARTVITAPATTERAAMWASTPNPNPHLLWMQGRFVGAERPNRNGAFWSTSDLEMGKPTVAHGPLNWLHEERHVIGTIADAQFVPSAQLSVVGTEAAAETTDPHLAALSAIWSWIYPQEASVVAMASDAGVLAYSMECISEAIQCVGDAGCGQTFPYMEVAAAGGGCAHLQQRGSVRRLVNPTFLGGAVIVPPTRPGWADANASVMREAASVAEATYEQAGQPDIPARTWEQLMASVIDYTRNPS